MERMKNTTGLGGSSGTAPRMSGGDICLPVVYETEYLSLLRPGFCSGPHGQGPVRFFSLMVKSPLLRKRAEVAVFAGRLFAPW